jgi:hypothetical protein
MSKEKAEMYAKKDPPSRCIDYFILADSGKATKWDLIKLSGNETAFNRWVESFLLKYNLLKEVQKGRVTYYEKTEDGELIHHLLLRRKLVAALKRLMIHDRLAPESAVTE